MRTHTSIKMNYKNRFSSLLLLVLLLFTFSIAAQQKTKPVNDPLPSWNEGNAKKAIIDFVAKTTKKGSANFVPVADRIACFDNDGTLWTEKPLPFQLYFVIDKIKAMAPQHPEWKDQQPYKGILEGDPKAALADGNKSLETLILETHGGMTTEEFDKSVTNWMATATHPKTGKHYNEMVFQPMLELLDYLRANGYKTFIVSGGGIDFMRVWAEKAYGIPPYQVVGSSTKVKFDTIASPPALVKLKEVNFNDDKLGKPVGIHEHIGKRPIFTAGNSDGDYGMMLYTTTGSGPRFGLYVYHTDPDREYEYGRGDKLAGLNKGLDNAVKYNWLIVDMKKDWKKIYPYDK
jgi:phosphoglycolate phosphatase-like HAD superfamily hydrolase